MQEGIILHKEEAGVDGNIADFPTEEGKVRHTDRFIEFQHEFGSMLVARLTSNC